MPPQKRIPTTISHDVLDQIGRDFKFNHGKGIAEWLKNSLDAYLVRRHRSQSLEPESGGWPVHLHLLDGPHLAVMDFAGAKRDELEDFLLNWFSTTAAARGGRVESAALAGGHGNGGKFYMREMWRGNARFCTWLDGRASSLVVDDASDGTCGYWEHEDVELSWRVALGLAFDGSGLSTGQVEAFISQTDPKMLNGSGRPPPRVHRRSWPPCETSLERERCRDRPSVGQGKNCSKPFALPRLRIALCTSWLSASHTAATSARSVSNQSASRRTRTGNCDGAICP